MTIPEPGDSTPIVGSQTDIAPLGLGGAKPSHEKTADEERGAIPWDAIAADPDFKKLLAAKTAFILPVTIFFLVYYIALPVLVGWKPDLMKQKVGSFNYAYLFALSQFFMAWAVAGFYVVKAAGWDKSAAALLAKFNKQ
jgi:uncharacterized membrane protein (DUF485 family)